MNAFSLACAEDVVMNVEMTARTSGDFACSSYELCRPPRQPASAELILTAEICVGHVQAASFAEVCVELLLIEQGGARCILSGSS